ncbi:hypothetical protein [Streptomyces sp. NBC_00620]|nr:hypothetical protein [Streptomyces sp. NBC_00620]MCX4979186.1 hypothetical protein [Streptomyces sp. NBC_00620]
MQAAEGRARGPGIDGEDAGPAIRRRTMKVGLQYDERADLKNEQI